MKSLHVLCAALGLLSGCLLIEPFRQSANPGGSSSGGGSSAGGSSSGSSGGASGGSSAGAVTPSACDSDADCTDQQCVLHLCSPIPACTAAATSANGPVIFFTDIESGPNTGGENDLGVFVTIYGLRLGVTGQVSVGGGEVGKYVQWNPADASTPVRGRRLEAIVVQLGPQTKTGNIVVITGGVQSNPLPFTVRAGSVFFVDPTAATNGNGSAATPFNSLYAARRPSVNPGDTVYIKGGTYTAMDPWTESGISQSNANFLLTAANAQSGTKSAPIAYIGYPGQQPTIGGASASAPSAHAIWMYDGSQPSPLNDYVFANIMFANTSSPFKATSNGVRFVSNALFGTDELWALNADNFKAYGNRLLSGTGTGIHFGGTYSAIELAWNEVSLSAGAAMFGNQQFVQTMSNDISIHDNLLYGGQSYGLFVFANNRTNGYEVFNNIIVDTAQDGLLLTDTAANTAGAQFKVTSNLVFTHAPDQFAIGTGSGDAVGTAGRFVLTDNVFETFTPANQYIDAGGANDTGAFSASYDLYYSPAGLNQPFEPDTVGKHDGEAPVYTNDTNLDYTPLSSSPIVDAGTPTPHCADYLGVPRPQGAAWDIGPFELVQ